MLTINQLRELARERIADAEALFAVRRYDGAVYICGYAVELALKARVCKTLQWAEYPAAGDSAPKKYNYLKTHDLDLLLSYSGHEQRIKTTYSTEWSAVASWNPESRYTLATKITRNTPPNVVADLRDKARLMIDSANILLKKL